MSKRSLSVILISALGFFGLAQAATFSATNSTDWQVDGSSDTRQVNLLAPSSAIIGDVELTIQFDKTGNGCPDSSPNDFAFHNEIVFRLTHAGTTENVVNAFQFSGGAPMPVINMVFDSDSPNPPDNGTPEAGTFRPQGDFSNFNGAQVAGVWTLFAQDTASLDPLCITSFTVTVTDTAPVLPDLVINKTASELQPEVGSVVTFTLQVENTGVGTATNVRVTDIVPAGFTYNVGTMTGGDAQNQSSPTGSGLIWTINSLAPAATPVTLTFQATVNPP